MVDSNDKQSIVNCQLSINIIPAIDLIDGKCVRLTKGDYSQKKQYDASPLDMAMRYQDIGIRSLYLVDLDDAPDRLPRKKQKSY